jgi:hypothetical protein
MKTHIALYFLVVALLVGCQDVNEGFAVGDIVVDIKRIGGRVFINSPSRYSEGLACIDYNGKYGYIDKKGKISITPRFDYAGGFSNGLAVVGIGSWHTDDKEEYTGDSFFLGKYGYINKKGEMVITPIFEEAYGFSEGMAKVGVGDFKLNENGQYSFVGKYGFIDELGNVAISPEYDEVDSFSGGLAKVKVLGKYGYINKAGVMVIRPEYDSAEGFSDGLALVSIYGKYGYINKSGDMVISAQYDVGTSSFFEGLAVVKTEGGWGYIDKNGNMAIKPQSWDMAFPFAEGMAAICMSMPTMGPNGVEYKSRYGYIDKTGKLVIAPLFEEVENFSGGLALVCNSGPWWDKKCGYIDKTGRLVVERKYKNASTFSEDMAWVMDDNGAYFISNGH